MTLRVIVTVVEIAAIALVLAGFLAKIGNQLTSISNTLGKIAFGVRAVETQCAVIGPATDRLNGELTETATGLGEVAQLAERLARR